MEKSAKRAVMALSIVIAVLALVVIYAFAVRPALNGYATQAYNQGVYDVARAVAQNGYVQIPVSNNQTMVLVQYKQPQQTASGTTQQVQSSTTNSS